MRKTIWPLLLLLTLAARLPAQVTVELLLEQDQFLRSESVPLRVRITNNSGQTLHLGAETNWLVFAVMNTDHSAALAMTGPGQETRAFDLEAAKSIIFRSDLMFYYNLAAPGHYTVSAKAKVAQISQEITSKTETFDIVSGATLWEKEFGVPARTPPEVRKFMLQQATHLKQQRLYSRVTDASGTRVYRVQSLGMLVSFATPETVIDPSSNLHVLFQTGQKSFAYCIVNPDGDLISRQTHAYTDTRPVLRTLEDGKVTRVLVAGGERLILPTDLPPPVVSTNRPAARPK